METFISKQKAKRLNIVESLLYYTSYNLLIIHLGDKSDQMKKQGRRGWLKLWVFNPSVFSPWSCRTVKMKGKNVPTNDPKIASLFQEWRDQGFFFSYNRREEWGSPAIIYDCLRKQGLVRGNCKIIEWDASFSEAMIAEGGNYLFSDGAERTLTTN